MHLLPYSLEHMKINMTHNKNIKTLYDIASHLQLEDEWHEPTRIKQQVYLTKNSKYIPSYKKKKNFHAKQFKGNKNLNVKPKQNKKTKYCGKSDSEKNMSKVKFKCFNCEKLNYFAKEHIKLKRVCEMKRYVVFQEWIIIYLRPAMLNL